MYWYCILDTHGRQHAQSLTRLSVQELLELAALVLNGLLHEVRPDVADSKVGHVHLHQVQHGEDLPARQSRTRGTGV